MNRKQFKRVVYLALTTMIPLGIIGTQPVIAIPQPSSVSPSVSPRPQTYLRIFNRAALSEHNAYRDTHHSPPMTPDSSLIRSAQSWANHLATIGELEHSDTGAGENLYVTYTTQSLVNPATLANQAMTMWYNEVSNYDYNNPGFSPQTGHFTQIVWKNSTQLGCGAARGVKTINGTQYNAFYVVCQYAPAGNVAGQFPNNVMAP